MSFHTIARLVVPDEEEIVIVQTDNVCEIL